MSTAARMNSDDGQCFQVFFMVKSLNLDIPQCKKTVAPS
jgi:hypothetical protein